MKYQDFMLVTDIDGTLADTRHQVSRKNKDAIAYFVSEGGRFAVATGRTQKNVLPYIEGLAINAPCILYNGGALFSWQEQRFLKTKHLAGADMEKYLQYCIQTFPKMCIQVFTQDQLYVITGPENVDEHMVRENQEFAYADLQEVITKPLIKVILCDEHESLIAGQEMLEKFHLAEKTNSFFSAPIYMEIVARSVSKGSMLKELITMEEFRNKKIIAAGDFHNDIEMLQLADCGVAPANAHDEVRQVADEIAVSNDEDLLHDIVYRILPKMV